MLIRILLYLIQGKLNIIHLLKNYSSREAKELGSVRCMSFVRLINPEAPPREGTGEKKGVEHTSPEQTCLEQATQMGGRNLKLISRFPTAHRSSH